MPEILFYMSQLATFDDDSQPLQRINVMIDDLIHAVATSDYVFASLPHVGP